MFRRFLALAACAALLGAAPTGALYVTTLPSAADVWIDGTYAGRTPMLLDDLVGGRHRLSITRAGWATQDLAVSVVAGTTSLSIVQLERAPGRVPQASGSLVVRGNAVRVLRIDGALEKPDAGGAYVLSAGTHELEAQTANGNVVRTVTIYPDVKTGIVFQSDADVPPAVVAPAEDFLAADAVSVIGARVTIHTAGHTVAAHIGSVAYHLDGRDATFDAAPTLIGGKLYLPLALLTFLTHDDAKAK
jgi:hypothetical protein